MRAVAVVAQSTIRQNSAKTQMLVLTLFGGLVSGCGVRQYPAEALDAAYKRAVEDANVVDAIEVSNRLVWISPANPETRWSAEKDRVLMVTWTGWSGYDDKIGSEIALTQEVWATAAPELERRCRAIPASTDFKLRLKQLLGLPPTDDKTRVV